MTIDFPLAKLIMDDLNKHCLFCMSELDIQDDVPIASGRLTQINQKLACCKKCYEALE